MDLHRIKWKCKTITGLSFPNDLFINLEIISFISIFLSTNHLKRKCILNFTFFYQTIWPLRNCLANLSLKSRYKEMLENHEWKTTISKWLYIFHIRVYHKKAEIRSEARWIDKSKRNPFFFSRRRKECLTNYIIIEIKSITLNLCSVHLN